MRHANLFMVLRPLLGGRANHPRIYEEEKEMNENDLRLLVAILFAGVIFLFFTPYLVVQWLNLIDELKYRWRKKK